MNGTIFQLKMHCCLEAFMKKCSQRIKKNVNKIQTGFPGIIKIFIKLIALLMTAAGVAQLFFEFETIKSLSWSFKILIILCCFLVIFILSVCLYFLFYRCKILFDYKDCKVISRYDDLFDIAFPRSRFKKIKRKIVVIPVNTTFDTIIDDDPAVDKPLVSPNTNHGRWIKHMLESGKSLSWIDSEISKSLKNRKEPIIQIFNKQQKSRGKLEEYAIGSIAIVNYEMTTFYLVALSSFDEKNHAQSSTDKVLACLDNVVKQYDSSQKYDIYLPLMGNGLSRAGLSDLDSYILIKNYLCLRAYFMHGNINIVVYKGNNDKIAL